MFVPLLDQKCSNNSTGVSLKTGVCSFLTKPPKPANYWAHTGIWIPMEQIIITMEVAGKNKRSKSDSNWVFIRCISFEYKVPLFILKILYQTKTFGTAGERDAKQSQQKV